MARGVRSCRRQRAGPSPLRQHGRGYRMLPSRWRLLRDDWQWGHAATAAGAGAGVLGVY